MSLRKVTFYDDPEKAEQEVDDYYRSLTPQQRLDEMVRLLNTWGKWNERRLERVAESLTSHQVRFLVVGAHAVAFYGRPRMTEDIDLLVDRAEENVRRLQSALTSFGAGISETGARDFQTKARGMIRLGIPPTMVDLINFGSPLSFEELWNHKVEGTLDGQPVNFPSKQDLIDMKKASGRPQDLVDVQKLEKA